MKAAKIQVERESGGRFRVRVLEGATSTEHEVTATPEEVARYGGGVTAERLLEASFEFLLEREPKESILGLFALPIIEHYFPEYPRVIAERCAV